MLLPPLNPALSDKIVGMDVLAGRDVRRRQADGLAVLDHRLATRDLGDGHLVAKWNGIQRYNVHVSQVDNGIFREISQRCDHVIQGVDLVNFFWQRSICIPFGFSHPARVVIGELGAASGLQRLN